MIRLLLASICAACLMASCTITQNFNFNEDWSGTYSLDIDMSQMAALMGGMSDSTASDSSSDMGMKDAISDLEKMDGITDVKYVEDEENGKYTISYNFRDVEALNASMTGSGLTKEMSKDGHAFFQLNGNKLTYTMPNINEGDDAPTADLAGMDDMMLDMMKYRLNFTFAKTVKKAKSKQLKKDVKSSSNSVNWAPEFKELMELEGQTSIVIQVK